ncbi:MAG TPA: hypothetical protein PKL08_15015 [Thermoanaerobaculaceae bacterium]|nr:hypothetical protein [Thermoanaerobaculaceae bacterium]
MGSTHEPADQADVLAHIELMVDVTAQVLAEDLDLTFCEALRLVDAARVAMRRLFPEDVEVFERIIRLRLDGLIEARFGLPPPSGAN